MKKFSFFWVTLVVLGVGWGVAYLENGVRTEGVSIAPAVHNPTAEPTPPDYLELLVDEGGALHPTIDFTVKVNTQIDSGYQLEVLKPAGARFESGFSRASFNADPDSSPKTESLRINKSTSNGVVVEVRLTLLDDNGEPWMVIDKSHVMGEAIFDPSATRYPVVFERSDGSKIVEYMTEAEAAQRGLLISDSSDGRAASLLGDSENGDEGTAEEEVQQ